MKFKKKGREKRFYHPEGVKEAISTGKPGTYFTWDADVGYVTALDGKTRIQASTNPGRMFKATDDGKGNITERKLTSDEFMSFSNYTDCHGYSFAGGEVWINNDQVMRLINASGYSPIDADKAQALDVGVYSTGKEKSLEVWHSVLMSTTPGIVLSKGGITNKQNVPAGPGPGTGWSDPSSTLQWYTLRKTP